MPKNDIRNVALRFLVSFFVEFRIIELRKEF